MQPIIKTEVWRFLVRSGCCDDVFAIWWLGPLSPGIDNGLWLNARKLGPIEDEMITEIGLFSQ